MCKSSIGMIRMGEELNFFLNTILKNILLLMFFRDEDILYIEQVTNVMHILTHLCYKM